MIKNVIFDIGQVLAHFRWREYIEDLGITGDDGERVARATVLGPYWDEVDRGVMTTQEIIEKCVELDSDKEDLIRLFYKDRRQLVTEYDYSADWITELKNKGYKVYLLSNFGEENFKYICSVYKFLGLEDGRVISYEEKCVKPEPRIYEILLERYSLKPEECVFIDDTLRNIEGAQKFGIKTVHFKSYEQARADLAGMGVK